MLLVLYATESLNIYQKFERGTISYMLSATLTRPTTITPTLICDRKIYLVEVVDIASMRQPKPRTITLEPITRRSKARMSAKKQSTLSNVQSNACGNDDVSKELPSNPDSPVPRTSDDPPESPSLSEVGSVSAVSSSNFSIQIGTGPPLAKSSKASDLQSGNAAVHGKTITAIAEMLRGGCLPGDNIPIRISIDHTKPVKSVQGIIITFYRLGRIDTHPAMPLATSQKGKNPEYEDYYPKSRTGLGGLSLSSAGSSHVFRMDLAQTFAPLIIDPHTLKAVISASVRVPDDVFPSISHVPGAMISFNYFVEVVMDLRGKLGGQDRTFPRLGITDVPSPNHGYANALGWRGGGIPGSSQVQSPNFVDTDQIRREKSVVACVFEITVGTRDSSRKATKRTRESEWCTSPSLHLEDMYDESAEISNEYRLEDAGAEDLYSGFEQDPREFDRATYDRTPMISLPEVEEELDEKALIRRAEERLLPSAPPLEADATSSILPLNVPSAPLSNALDQDYRPVDEATTPAYAGPLQIFTGPIRPSDGYISWSRSRQEDLPTDRLNHNTVEDDKQEMERHRLLAAASAPSDGYDEEEGEASAQTRSHVPAPSAPVLNENDEYQLDCTQDSYPGTSSRSALNDHYEGIESLPRYRK